MPVIVFNKRTGKYLRKHSGSFNHYCRVVGWRSEVRQEIQKQFGECPFYRDDPEGWNKFRSQADELIVDKTFDAPPEDARVYHSASSTITSIGSWSREDKKYHLPDFVEIHEIKESFVCVMRPDGSSNCDDEETK